jgi:3-oxoacyl-[acyl-carrier protein] reductase
VQGTVAPSDDVARLVGEAHTALGRIDILVNNAGVFPRSPFLELAEAEWDHVRDVNLKGSFLVAQAIAQRMVAARRKGAIVNLSSSSVRGHPLGVHYAAGKADIIGMTRAMTLALAPNGIRVNARLVPLGAMAKPADIADIIVFLASDRSRFIAGEVVHANGGLYMA